MRFCSFASKHFVLAGLFLITALPAQAESRILRPDPALFSQLGAFEPEWCGEKLCWGSVRFRQATRVRAILVQGKAPALYVEDDFRGIDLLKPAFGVLGPVNAHPTLRVETGRAVVTFDPRGEVDSVRMQTPALGTLGELRR